MRNGFAIAHSVIGAAAVLLAIFCPQPGSASRMVPLGDQDAGDVAVWAAREQARLVAYEPAGDTVIVIAPTSLSLARAAAQGLVPIAADLPVCAPSTRDTSQKSVAR
ncbi:MAG: hypothetical protein AAF650_01535 [Pseudomonadota bacterium]